MILFTSSIILKSTKFKRKIANKNMASGVQKFEKSVPEDTKHDEQKDVELPTMEHLIGKKSMKKIGEKI